MRCMFEADAMSKQLVPYWSQHVNASKERARSGTLLTNFELEYGLSAGLCLLCCVNREICRTGLNRGERDVTWRGSCFATS